MEKWFGMRPEQFVGTNGWDFIDEEDLPRLAEAFERFLQGEKSSSVVCRCRHINGERRYIAATAACAACAPAWDAGTHRPSISLGYSARTFFGQEAGRALVDAERMMSKRKLLERKSLHSSLIASIQAHNAGKEP